MSDNDLRRDAELLAAQFKPSADEDKARIVPENGVSPCGVKCSVCRFAEETGCTGCTGDCEIYSCCAEKGICDCSGCGDFPCDMLKAAAFDPETGDDGARLMRLKSIAEKKKRMRRMKTEPLIIGLSCGVFLGICLGASAGSTALWTAVCALAGGCSGYIIGMTKK